jgi:hypothetical protein
MSENVIRLPTKVNEERIARQEKRSATRRVATVRSRIDKNPVIRSRRDKATLAMNMWRILDDLEKGPLAIGKARILQAAGQGGPNDSTKRLLRFAFPPHLNEDEKGKRVDLLAKKIPAYIVIINKAAELSAGDADKLLERLIAGTSYDLQDLSSEDEDARVSGWDDIEDALLTITEGIASKHDLPGFFRTVEDYEVSDVFRLESREGRRDLYRTLRSCSLPTLIMTANLAPRPSVFLGRMQAFADIPCTIRLSASDGYGEREAELRAQLAAEDLNNIEFDGVAHPRTSCWLELMPFGDIASVIPVLRFESETEIVAKSSFDALAQFGGETWKRGESLGVVDGALEECSDVLHDGTEDLGVMAFDEETDSLVGAKIEAIFETDGLVDYLESDHARRVRGRSLIIPFNSSARAYLSNPVIAHGGRLSDRFCYETAREMLNHKIAQLGEDFTVFGNRTMAAAFERSLFAEPLEVRIDRLLSDSTRKMVEKLNDELGRAHEQRRKRLATIVDHYRGSDPDGLA